MRREVSEELGVGQVPPAAGSVGHGVARTRNVVMHGNIAMVSLVKSVEAQEVGAGGARGG